MRTRSSYRWGWLLLLALLAALAAPGASAAGGQLTIAEYRTDDFPRVVVRVRALDTGGSPLEGLETRDFTVEENGQPVAGVIVHTLRQGKTPLAVVLTVDVSGSMNDQAKLTKAKAAAKTFIAGLREIDQVELVSFSDRVQTVVPFTSNRATLGRGIDGLVAKGNTALYDATDQSVAEAQRIVGSQAVVVLSDGEDTASKVPLAQTLGLATQAHVPIYTIGLGSDVKDDVLTRIARETGGRYYKAPTPDDLAYAFRLLSQQIANEYELFYYSPADLPAGAKIDVTVRLGKVSSEGPSGRFSYLMPAVRREQSRRPPDEAPAPVDPGQLRAVVETPRPTPVPFVPSSQPYSPEVPALVFAVGVLALCLGLFVRLTPDLTETRLGGFVASVARPGARRQAASGGQLLVSLARWLAGIFARYLPDRQIEETRRLLTQAGNPYDWGPEEYFGVRLLLGITLGLLMYLLSASSRGVFSALLLCVLVGGIGFLLPAFWLGSKIRARQREILRALPNALDLLSVSVEAGLGFDQAVAEVVQKWHNALTAEFAILLGELQVGRSRRDALRGLMARTGVAEVGGFASALIQSDELGASIARTLNVQAEQIRIRRRQRAEQQAREAAIKMLFPLVFLMFPSLFIVILGPAVPAFIDAFANVLK